MKFTKMQGCGNDYVYINCFEENVEDPSELSKNMSNRNFGVGSDGLILVMPSDVADCKMRMFNSDGSESEMCGNGIRCVGKFVHDKNIVKKDIITVETLAGIKTLEFFKDDKGAVLDVKVNMGCPIFNPKDIPVISDEEIVKNLKLKALDKEFIFTCLSMGNPHAITFVDDVDNFDVDKYGSILESNPAFPKRANIEFVEVLDNNNLKMRVFERGSGETFACGTGTCATVVASFLNGKCHRENVDVKLLGGTLNISWSQEDNNVYMTGPARFVFEGDWLL
ncbi:diaminopimelate epimerase [uncultured Tyzzerella sp.]|uniref:diaminopimelate epimerase n=1 Tax=uncultured Tyzzerella sp. TaxID=2321398 RepID=UPI002943BB2E|nr:diaminopimelate epimerase [uncultured Tyzzerella sp.]